MELVQSFFLGVIDVSRYCRGFRGKNAQIDQFDWSYMERDGSKAHTTEPVVFIHGFSSQKESWTNLASRIDSKYQIIVPDLPGQGRTTPADPTLDYSMDSQAQRLHQFLDKTVPADRKVHLIGCSMGGMLAGVYSAKYPDRVRTLTMICPAGISMPRKSDAYQLLDDTGKNLLLGRTPDDFIEMITYIGYRPHKVPRWAATLIASFREKQMPVYEKIVQDSLINRTILEDNLHLIQAKSLIFWGKNDRILDVSSLPILEEKLANVPQKYAFVFDECGHTVQHEKYNECAKAINEFLDGNTPSV